MRFIFMLMVLSVFTGPVFANQQGNAGECLKMYRAYLNDYEAREPQARELMLYFSNVCMPESAYSDDPQYNKLLQLREIDDRVITIET